MQNSTNSGDKSQVSANELKLRAKLFVEDVGRQIMLGLLRDYKDDFSDLHEYMTKSFLHHSDEFHNVMITHFATEYKELYIDYLKKCGSSLIMNATRKENTNLITTIVESVKQYDIKDANTLFSSDVNELITEALTKDINDIEGSLRMLQYLEEIFPDEFKDSLTKNRELLINMITNNVEHGKIKDILELLRYSSMNEVINDDETKQYHDAIITRIGGSIFDKISSELIDVNSIDGFCDYFNTEQKNLYGKMVIQRYGQHMDSMLKTENSYYRNQSFKILQELAKCKTFTEYTGSVYEEVLAQLTTTNKDLYQSIGSILIKHSIKTYDLDLCAAVIQSARICNIENIDKILFKDDTDGLIENILLLNSYHPEDCLKFLDYFKNTSQDWFKDTLFANAEQLTIAINQQITNGQIKFALELLEHASSVGISDGFIKEHCATVIRDRYVLGGMLMDEQGVDRNDVIKLAKFTLSGTEQEALSEHLKSIEDDIIIFECDKQILETNQELASAFRKIADEIVLFNMKEIENFKEVQDIIISINNSIGYPLLSVNAEINSLTLAHLTHDLKSKKELFNAGYIPRNEELSKSLHGVIATHSASNAGPIWQASEFYYANVLNQLEVLDKKNNLKDDTLDKAADRYYNELKSITSPTDIQTEVRKFIQPPIPENPNNYSNLDKASIDQDKTAYTVVTTPSRIALTRKQMIGAAYLLHERSLESNIEESNIEELTQQIYESATPYNDSINHPSCGPGTATRISAAFVYIKPELRDLYEEEIKKNQPIIANKEKLAEAVAQDLLKWAQESEENAQILNSFTAGDVYLYSTTAQNTLQIDRKTLPDERMLAQINQTLYHRLQELEAQLPTASELYAVAGAVLETKLIRDHIIAGEITGQMAETILQMAMNDKALLDALPAINSAQTETILEQYIGAEEQKVEDLNRSEE